MVELVVWADSLSVGIDEIDLQHRKLLEICGELYTASKLDSEQYKLKMSKVIKSVTDYTVYHFREEEALQRRYGYPQADFHKIQHDDFVSSVSEQVNKLNENDPADGANFYAYLANWIVTHVAKSDKIWAGFVKKAMEK